MFAAIRAIATEYLRTNQVSLQKDPARGYGGRERQGSATLNPGSKDAAVVHVGSRARALARDHSEQRAEQKVEPFRQVLREVETRQPSIDVLGRAVQAAAEPFVSFGSAVDRGQVVPYEALRLAAASQDPRFADPPLPAFAGLPLPLLGEDALSIYEQSSADESDAMLRPSERAKEPFGRDVPFDLRHPDGDESETQTTERREGETRKADADAREARQAELEAKGETERAERRAERAAEREKEAAEVDADKQATLEADAQARDET
jgi:hypothetical protein